MIINEILVRDIQIKPVIETLLCDHSDQGYGAVAVYKLYNFFYAVRSGSYFEVCGWSPYVWPFKWSYGAVAVQMLYNYFML